MKFRGKIRAIGTSKGGIIPAPVLKELGWDIGTPYTIDVKGEKLIWELDEDALSREEEIDESNQRTYEAMMKNPRLAAMLEKQFSETKKKDDPAKGE